VPAKGRTSHIKTRAHVRRQEGSLYRIMLTNGYNGQTNFDVLLTVHLSIYILVINQLDAQNFVLQ